LWSDWVFGKIRKGTGKMKKTIYLVFVLLFSLCVSADTLCGDTSDLMVVEETDQSGDTMELELADLFQADLTDASLYRIDLSESGLFTVAVEDCLWDTVADIDAVGNTDTIATALDVLPEEVILVPELTALFSLDLD
jgi:hypothetical protein